MTIQEYLQEIDRTIENGKYKADWDSLAQYPVPQWYRDTGACSPFPSISASGIRG